jgi:hypothetical protein
MTSPVCRARVIRPTGPRINSTHDRQQHGDNQRLNG